MLTGGRPTHVSLTPAGSQGTTSSLREATAAQVVQNVQELVCSGTQGAAAQVAYDIGRSSLAERQERLQSTNVHYYV